MNRLNLLLVHVVLAAVCISASPATRPSDEARIAAEVRSTLLEFKRANLPADQRKEIGEKLLGLGEEGQRRLLVTARQDYLDRSPGYRSRFEKAAADVLRARWKDTPPERELTDLRRTVLDVAHSGNLTKEMIVEKSDPAMKRINELLEVSAEEILKATPALANQRQELLDLLELAGKAAEQLPPDVRKKMPAVPDAKRAAEEIVDSETIAAALAGGINPADRSVLQSNIALAAKIDPEEARGIFKLNIIRIRLGLGAQLIDPKLVDAARGHSKDMVELKFFSHESPAPGRENPWRRASAAGTSASAENIAAGSNTGDGAIQMWWHSPGHHKNMLGGQKRTGLGRYKDHWTQMFG